LGLTGALFAGGVQPARAINEEWSAALGFIGGVLVASHSSRDCAPNVYYTPPATYCPPPARYERVVYSPPPVYVQEPCYERPRYVETTRCEPRGYYEYRQERRWIAGSWYTERTTCHSTRQVWSPGRWEYSTVKVWVDGR